MKCQYCGKTLANMRYEAKYCGTDCKDMAWQAQRKLQRAYDRILDALQDIDTMHTSGKITDTQYKAVLDGIRRQLQ